MPKQKHETASLPSNLAYHGVSFDATVMARQLDKALRILRVKHLVERTNLSRATLYVLMANDPTFPQKIRLTARTIGFLESEVDAWIESRAQLRGAV